MVARAWTSRMAVVLAAQLVLLGGGCAGKVKQQGPYVMLPGGSYPARHVKQLATGRSGKSYAAFDRRYPGEWPAGLTLPEDCYLVEDGKITLESATLPGSSGQYLYTYPITGICHCGAAELTDKLRQSLLAAGLAVERDVALGPAANAESGVMFPAAQQLEASGGTDTFAPRLSVTVYDEAQLDGWTYFTGQLSTGR